MEKQIEQHFEDAKKWFDNHNPSEWRKVCMRHQIGNCRLTEELLVKTYLSETQNNTPINKGMESNGWTKLPAKELLPFGFYWIKVKQPTTGVEDIFVYELNSGAGILPFAWATHYQPITKPQPPIF